MKSTLVLSVIAGLLAGAAASEIRPWEQIWFDEPATMWEEAVPVGNGTLGVMVFGGVEKARFSFNEDTLWTGHPHDYAHKGAVKHLAEIRRLVFEGRQKEAEQLAGKEFMSEPLRQNAYTAFGDLVVTVPDPGEVSEYRRELDLRTATATTSYVAGGVRFERQCFVSAADKVIVIRVTADQPGQVSLDVTKMSPQKEHKVEAAGGQVHLSGSPDPPKRLDGFSSDMTFHSIAAVEAKGGKTETKDGVVSVTQADEVVIRLVAATNFIDYKTIGADPKKRCEKVLAAVGGRNFENLAKAHQVDHLALYGRVKLNLGQGENSALPVNERLDRFGEAPGKDPALVTLVYNYGRYLLIGSSRPGSQPANLQGIWNHKVFPTWDSKYTCNINTEMNYWLAEMCDLPECHEPLFKMIEEVAQTGRNVATEHYGARGWVMHHNTDLWRGAAPINASNHGIWPTGGAWLCQHLWLHYAFTQDEKFLKERAYPVLKAASEFFLDTLVEDPRSEKAWLISCPSNSPEQGGLVAGPTMDHQIIRSLLGNTAEAATVLGVDEKFAAQLKDTAARIAPNQIGRHGQLQEWLEDVDNPKNKHRHVSHLWGLHPGREITRYGTPDLFEASKVTLAHRGDGGTGWSMGWKINFWARLQDGDHALTLIRNQLRPAVKGGKTMGGGGTYPNLFDAHPPFQIDGNFGFTSGVTEMLVQSHAGEIQFLPALPTLWKDGSVCGLRARGGIGVDLSWKDGKFVMARLRADKDLTVRLRLGEETREVELKAGKHKLLMGW